MTEDGVDVLPSIPFPEERISQAQRNNHQHRVYDRNNGGSGTILALGSLRGGCFTSC